MSDKQLFKAWVPRWLIFVTTLLLLLPTLLLFAMSTANVSAAVGYYGIEPADVQFSLLVFYAAIAAFTPLEARFFNRIATKEYLLICLSLQLVFAYAVYHSHHLGLILPIRFLQGIVNCGTTSICLNLLFRQLTSGHSREIGYSIFYGLILCVAPLTSLMAAPLIDQYDYKVIYKAVTFCIIPGAVMLLSIMHNVRLSRKTPLSQLDWISFVLYASALVLIAYILVYGQQLNWLDNTIIRYGVFLAPLLLGLSYVRQKSIKRPYIDVHVFRYKNVWIGIFLLIMLYLVRGSFNLSNQYFAEVLGMDPIHTYRFLLWNIFGIVIGCSFSTRLVILKKSLRALWCVGFSLLAIYHISMVYLFGAEANADSYIFLLILQGIGAGLLMGPIVLFIISSVPSAISKSASAVGVFIRFTTFSLSLASLNFYQRYYGQLHSDQLADRLDQSNPMFAQRLSLYKQALVNKGMLGDQAGKAADLLLAKSLQKQSFLRYCMDYYALMALICVVTIALILLLPIINKTIINVKHKQPAAAGF
ncbi:MFS transporter [Olivibacter sp. XZL3]|uniref:MFS transporter n=1 Tax=Olivibacter sp. XZL3 TaxID=1735116 RepID=UPI001065E157|nr:MFS transporter [Olivibacter sp. XZL3]